MRKNTKIIIETIVSFIIFSIIFVIFLTNIFGWNNILVVLIILFNAVLMYWGYINGYNSDEDEDDD